MNIQNGIESLTQIQPSQTATPAKAPQSASTPVPQSTVLASNTDNARLSSAGTQVAQSASTASISDSADLRLDKVASIQAQLQAGTYSVPASAVAQKVIGALLVPKQ